MLETGQGPCRGCSAARHLPLRGAVRGTTGTFGGSSQGVLSSLFGQKVSVSGSFYLKERGDPQEESSLQPYLKGGRCIYSPPGTQQQLCWPQRKPEQVSESRQWCKSTNKILSTACWGVPGNPSAALQDRRRSNCVHGCMVGKLVLLESLRPDPKVL